jgi:hypothetical protein
MKFGVKQAFSKTSLGMTFWPPRVKVTVTKNRKCIIHDLHCTLLHCLLLVFVFQLVFQLQHIYLQW